MQPFENDIDETDPEKGYVKVAVANYRQPFRVKESGDFLAKLEQNQL